MQINLSQKSILLGITGSISVYKACEIARLFVKAGAEVHVVMTPSAERFVSALTFEALTRNKVLTESSETWSSTLNHIEKGKISDVLLIAPATANTLNKLSLGVADNILLQTALAFKGSIVVAPSANTQMLNNPFTQRGLNILEKNHTVIVKPQEKVLACGDRGEGALSEPNEIFFQTSKKLLEEPFWKDREVIITGGGSKEKIDEVRYLSNFSSGKMAQALCLALYLKGANVTYITTVKTQEMPLEIQTIQTQSAKEILDHTQKSITRAKINSSQKEPYLFMVGAIADYTPHHPFDGKLKKATLGKEWTIKLKQTQDILSLIDKNGIKTIAFKAEMDEKEGLNNAMKLLKEKNVDGVCYNLLKNASSFGTKENEITFITPHQKIALGKDDKLSLSFKILDNARQLIYE